MTEKRKFTIQLSKKQSEALKATDQFLLYGGAKGGGKSWFLNVWLFNQIRLYPGNKLFMFRRRAVDLINTTLETWKKCIHPSLYKINEQKRKIFIPDFDGTIDFGGLEDENAVEKLNSAEYGGGVIDQAEEVGRDHFGMCRGTLRHVLPDGSNPSYQIRMSANPAQCWLKDDFILAPKPNCKYVKALPFDNPHLPKDYVDNLQQGYGHRPELVDAYVNGNWDALSSSDVFIPSDKVEDALHRKPYGTVLKRVIANDPATFGDDENVLQVWERTEVMDVLRHQEILPKQDPTATAGYLHGKAKEWKASAIVVDYAGIGEGIVSDLNSWDANVIKCDTRKSPDNKKAKNMYDRLKAQIYNEAAKRFIDGKVSLPTEDRILAGQLSQNRFKFTSGGKMQALSKEDLKKQYGKSPDRSDCTVIGIWGLDKAPRLDEKEYVDKTTDRQGSGTEVKMTPQDVVGIDYSGYGM